MRKINGKISNLEDRLIQVSEPVAVTRAGMHWGVLRTRNDELWCGFTRQSCGVGTDLLPVVDMPSRMHVVQRREYVRVLSPGALSRFEVLEVPDGGTLQIADVREIKISAGGASLHTEPQLPLDARVALTLDLGDGRPIDLEGQVVRVVRPEGGEPFVAVSFTNARERQRERIARFLHQVQLGRKRGT